MQLRLRLFPQLLVGLLLVTLFMGGTLSSQTAKQTEPIRVDQGKLHYLSTLLDGRVVSLDMHVRSPDDMENPGPTQPIFVRYSEDNGLSWSDADTAFSYGGGDGIVYGGYSFADNLGNLHCFGIRYYRLPKRELKGYSVLLHNYSRDGGKTWTEPQKVDFGHEFTGAFNTIIELKSGRLVFALDYPTELVMERGEPEGKIVTVYSDDHGETWVVGADGISVPPGEFRGHPGALEPVMVELKDNRIWMIIRTQQRRFYQTFSDDGGKNWTQTTLTNIEAPNSPAGILRLSDGRLVLCWNDLSQFPEGQFEGSGRQYLHIAISSDDGKTWSKSKQIAQREEGELPNTNVAYPYLNETQDHHVLVAYHRVGNGVEGVSWWHPIVEVLRIDPDWIGNPED